MTKMVRRVTGSELLAEVGEFFAAFEGMYDGFKERAGLVYDQLKHPSTAFVVVATPDGAALREAAYFAGRLAADRMPLGALVVNRIHRAGPVPGCRRPRGAAWPTTGPTAASWPTCWSCTTAWRRWPRPSSAASATCWTASPTWAWSRSPCSPTTSMTWPGCGG